MKLLKANPNKNIMKHLCRNPEALPIIEKLDPLFIDYEALLCNPNIFVLDYAATKKANAKLHEELIAYVYHPSRVAKWVHQYGTESEYLE